jgi:ribosomal protein L17
MTLHYTYIDTSQQKQKHESKRAEERLIEYDKKTNVLNNRTVPS